MASPSDSTNSETITPEKFCLEAMQQLPGAVERFARGDRGALNELEQRALELAAGQVQPHQIKQALSRKFGDGG